MRFVDRHHAGRRLAAELTDLTSEQPIVVALPRGGVPVAFEVSRQLGAPLELLAVRKLGAPGNPELAVGAVAEDGTGVLDQASIARLRISATALEEKIARESGELARRVERYRGSRPPALLRERTVVLVDDGVATGLTELAGIHALRRRGPSRIVVAVPVGASESVAMLGHEADSVLCLQRPEILFSVGSWYLDFSPVTDSEVLSLLARADAGEPDPA